ncbi:glycosyltransferase family 61 protein, partial [Pelagibacteraceae bacterium]|nr:glycosyltransferase family 61 protein [Pelagibacteraceae bacterium]
YWHWMFDVLPRIKIIQDIIKINEINYFLLPNLNNKFQFETLDLIGIPKEKRLSSLKLRHLECEQIISTDHPYVLNNNASNEIQNLPMWIINWLKNTLTQKLHLEDKNFPSKIYIDRSDAHPNIANLRKIINENEVVEFVKKLDFKIITLSNYSYIDQIKLFYNAKNIIGLHGAGFANVIFSKPELKILELKPLSAGKMCENLIKKCNINYDHISVKPEKFDLNNQMGHIRINVSELEKKYK